MKVKIKNIICSRWSLYLVFVLCLILLSVVMDKSNSKYTILYSKPFCVECYKNFIDTDTCSSCNAKVEETGYISGVENGDKLKFSDIWSSYDSYKSDVTKSTVICGLAYLILAVWICCVIAFRKVRKAKKEGKKK